MYNIYADGKLLYAPYLSNEGYGVFSPKLTLELNKAGSLEFTLPPNNVLYNDIKKLTTIITVVQNGELLFRGRVLHDDKDFYKQKKTYCEGDLSFLLDSRQRPYAFTGTAGEVLEDFISRHNSRVEANKRFTVGTTTVTTKITCSNDSYGTTLDEINNQILGNVGGYIRTRTEGDAHYIDLLKESGNVNTQTIEFASNLLDISEYITAEDVFTVIIPLGKTVTDEDGHSTGRPLTITARNDGKDYLEDETAISLFGRIEKVEEWSEIDNDVTLKQLGNERLKENIELATTLTVKAVDLNLLNVAVERIRLGDLVRVVSIPHGLDKQFQCTKIVYDLTSPDQNEYVFGTDFKSFTSQQVNEKNTIRRSVSVVSSAANTINASISRVDQAVEEVQVVISNMPTEYVKAEEFDALESRVDYLEASGGGGSGGCGIYFTVDDTLTLKNGVLSVNTAEDVEADNTLPVTSAAVHVEIGNIDALLQTI